MEMNGISVSGWPCTVFQNRSASSFPAPHDTPPGRNGSKTRADVGCVTSGHAVPRVRLRERGEGSAASLAQQPRDAFDLVQVLQQQRTVARVLVVCTIPKADTEAQRLTLAPSLASSTRD